MTFYFISEPITTLLESGRSLADISLEDALGLDQLDEFLGPLTDEIGSDIPGDELLREDDSKSGIVEKKEDEETWGESSPVSDFYYLNFIKDISVAYEELLSSSITRK